MNLVLIGMPGAGKGTYSRILSKKYNIPVVSTGDILRNAINQKNEISNKVKSYIERGELVPDDLVISIVENKLKSSECEKGFILDGFPRTKFQAEALQKVMEKNHRNLDIVINVEVSMEVLLKRLSGRRICRLCGAGYNVITSPPKNDKICDLCRGEIYQREDDREEVVKQRIIEYDKQTKPLISYYQNKNVLKTVKSNDTVDKVMERIMSVLEKK